MDVAMPRGDLPRSPPTPAPVDETVDLLHVEATHLRRSPLAPNHPSGVLLPVKDVGQRVLHRPRIARGRARDAPVPVPRAQPRHEAVQRRELAPGPVDDVLARVSHGGGDPSRTSAPSGRPPPPSSP